MNKLYNLHMHDFKWTINTETLAINERTVSKISIAHSDRNEQR